MKLYHFPLLLLVFSNSCNQSKQTLENEVDSLAEDSIYTGISYPVQDDRFNKTNSVLLSFSKSSADEIFTTRDTKKDSLGVIKTDSLIEINYYKMLGGSPLLNGDCKLENDSLHITYWYELSNPDEIMPSVMASYKLTYRIIPTSYKGIKVEQLNHYYTGAK